MSRLDRLLHPRSIAVIGGGIWCENVIRECGKLGYAGTVFAVHPERSEVAGCPAVPKVRDLPEAPDAAFIGVNRTSTIDIVRTLSHMGAGGAVCFASGFSEAADELQDATDLQADLIEAAGAMPLLGPNCYGFINGLDRAPLWPDQHGMTAVDRGVALITQSSNMGINLTMQRRGLPLAFLATVGNQANTGMSEVAEALLDDDRVTAIGLHIEGIDDLARFQTFARRAKEVGKPVVVLKAGRSDAARTAAISHTASLAGSAVGASALFRRLGMAEVRTPSSLLEALKILHVWGPLAAPEIASMSCSGGEASLMADMADGLLGFPALGDTQRDRLRQVLGPKVALSNPLDYHTYIWGDVDAMTATFAAMVEHAALGVVILDMPRDDRCDPRDWVPALTATRRARAETGKPFAVASSLPEGLSEATTEALIDDGIIPLQGIETAVEAIHAVSATEGSDAPVFIPKKITNPTVLSEDVAKARLSAAGLAVPAGRVVTAGEAASAAVKIGYPVALKALGFAHKTEAGALALNLESDAAVAEAVAKLPGKRFLVEQMVKDALAELLVGIVHDLAHGMVLTLGAGGVLTELMADSTSLILPASRADIEAAIDRLTYARVLLGYRGSEPCDIDKIIDVVLALQNFAMKNPVTEIEINPLLCGKDFAIAADALIKCGEHDE